VGVVRQIATASPNHHNCASDGSAQHAARYRYALYRSHVINE